jgi:hypothetical protein
MTTGGEGYILNSDPYIAVSIQRASVSSLHRDVITRTIVSVADKDDGKVLVTLQERTEGAIMGIDVTGLRRVVTSVIAAEEPDEVHDVACDAAGRLREIYKAKYSEPLTGGKLIDLLLAAYGPSPRDEITT